MATKQKTTTKKEKTKKETPKAKKKGLEAPLYDREGKVVGKVVLSEEIFNQKSNDKLVAQAARIYLSNQKPKTASTKTRAEISGGGRKPHRQKGTGRARVGSIRVPQWRGGGVVFGPRPTSSLLSLPKKVRQKALCIALSSKYSQNSLIFIEKLSLKEPKTKKASEILTKLPLKNKKRVLLILEKPEEPVIKSFRNLKGLEINRALDLNVLNVLKSSGLIFTLPALQSLQERFKYEPKKST
jgi:large subunit ribosomal protein L4